MQATEALKNLVSSYSTRQRRGARRRAVTASLAAYKCKRGKVRITKHNARSLRAGWNLEVQRPVVGHARLYRSDRFRWS